MGYPKKEMKESRGRPKKTSPKQIDGLSYCHKSALSKSSDVISARIFIEISPATIRRRLV